MPWPPWASEHKLKLSFLCCFTQGAKAKNDCSFPLVTCVGDNATDNTSNSNMLVLGLASLGSMTKNRNDPICVMLPKVTKASI